MSGTVPQAMQCPIWGGFGKAITQTEHPVKVKHYIISGKLAAICRRYVLPVDSLAHMENKSAWGRKLPALHQTAPLHMSYPRSSIGRVVQPGPMSSQA